MPLDYKIAFVVAVVVGVFAGIAVVRVDRASVSAVPFGRLFLGALFGGIVASLVFLLCAGVAGLFYFLGGPTPAWQVLAFTLLMVFVIAAFAIAAKKSRNGS